MSENLDNLLVKAFSQNLFKGVQQDIEEGEIDKEDGEIDSGDEDKQRHKKLKLKAKHKSKIKSNSIKSKSKKLSKSDVKIKSKSAPVKEPLKSSSKSGSKTVSKSSSKIKTKKSTKSSDKSVKTESDENQSEVMKLLLSKQLRSYADIQFKDEEKSPEKELPKKSSKHKTSKSVSKADKRSDKTKKHKKHKYSDEYYEPQKDSYFSSHSSTAHEDYFYGSYYEGMSSAPSDRSRSRGYSRPYSPLYEDEWRHRSRSRSPIDYGSRRRSLSPEHRSKDRYRSESPFFKDRYSKVQRNRRSLSPSDRSRRSVSVCSRRSVDRIDKQKLLEIARINLIKMIEKGDLPKGTDINKLKLRHLRELTTQKSVQQWTEFCRAISTLESSTCDSHSDSDFDSDNEDVKSVASDQPFSIRHPFKLNERKDIQIRVRGFPQLPSRSAKEMAQELREQFPVSSGNQHRRKEIEWHEVEAMPPPALPAPKAKRIDTKLTAILNHPKNTSDDQIAYKIIPATTSTTGTTSSTPAISSTTPTSSTESTTLTTTITPVPCSPQPVPPPDDIIITESTSNSTTDSTQVSSTSTESSDSVFPQSSMPIDIGSVMAQRLSAMRKLQEDPHNVVALKQMYQANQMMTEWAESKIVPGQFIGSTGANILTPEQLTGSFNAWTRKDQLKTAAPITDGIGMLLLLKMGWTPGQGLGKNNEGTVNPIMLEIKTDKKGLVAEEEQVRNLPLQLVSTAPPGTTGNAKFLSSAGKNPVSILHELCAKKKWTQPEYELVNEMGPDHRKNFTFKVLLNGVEYQPSVSSANKKQAKALAAGVCLQAFGLLPKDNT